MQNKLHIICKLEKQYYLDYIQKEKELEEKDYKYYHYWAIVGHNFRSNIYIL